MNKLLTIFFLSLVSAKASAQLNTFESGQTIKADEMNENFKYLDDRVISLGGSAVGCSNELLSGTWADQTFYDSGRETIMYEFLGNGTGVAELTRPLETQAELLSVTYSVTQDCEIAIEVEGTEIEGRGFLAFNGVVMSLVFYKPTTEEEDIRLVIKLSN